MSVEDLKGLLEDLPPDAEVRFASQPSWPFEYRIDSNYVISEDQSVVYLAESNQIGYLPGEIATDLGWR